MQNYVWDVNAALAFVIEFLPELKETFFDFVFNFFWQLCPFDLQVGVFGLHLLTDCLWQRLYISRLFRRSGMLPASFIILCSTLLQINFLDLLMRPWQNGLRCSSEWLGFFLLINTLFLSYFWLLSIHTFLQNHRLGNLVISDFICYNFLIFNYLLSAIKVVGSGIGLSFLISRRLLLIFKIWQSCRSNHRINLIFLSACIRVHLRFL